MIITIDSRMYYASGIGTYLRQLLPIMISDKPKWHFNLIGNREKLSSLQIINQTNVNIIDCTAPIYSIKEQMTLPELIPANTNLYFAPHYNIPVFYGGTIVTTIHDIFHISEQNKGSSFLKKFYARTMLKQAMEKSRIVMTDSEFTKNEMIKYQLPGLDKVRVVYIGFGNETAEELSGNRRLDSNYILYVGNVKPHKNLRGLIDAYKNLVNDNKINIPLVIVGETEKFITGLPELKDEIVNSVWKDKIRFTGWVDDRQLAEYYRYAVALIHPSFYEGFGLPPLEAMSHGIPAVVSNVASLPEICGEAVLYCDPYDINDIADKIFRIVTDDNLRDDLIKRGFQQIKKYDWRTTAENIYNVFEETAKK